MDFYLEDKNCIERLFNEWKQHKSLIVAYDYDNTVNDYHKKGYSYNDVIELLRECKKNGFHLIVFTSCNEDRFPEIKSNLEENNIPYDSINETPEYIPFKGRKVYFNILLDDRAGLSSAYNQLWTVIYNIRAYNSTNNLT